MKLCLCYNLFRCRSNKSHTMLLACGSTVDSPLRFLQPISLLVIVTLVRVPTRSSSGRVYYLCPIRSSLLFDAEHVSAAPRLIYHSNYEWRMRMAEVQRKAAPTLPSLTLYLVICAKAVPSMEKGDLVLKSSRWAKTTLHTSL